MQGRIRLNVPALGRDRRLGEKLLAWLGAQSGVRSARINYDCASLVLEYDPAHEPTLRALLDLFKRSSIAEVKAFCTQTKQDSPSSKLAPETKKESPLALPTLSLVMAFSANPAIAVINLPLMLWNAMPIAKRAWKVWDSERRLNIDVLDTLAITSSRLKDAGFWRGGNLAKPEICSATTAWQRYSIGA